MYGYEDAGERWLPVHTVETVVRELYPTSVTVALHIRGIVNTVPLSQLISVISLLSQNKPDLDSPANVDAAKEVRDDYACE